MRPDQGQPDQVRPDLNPSDLNPSDQNPLDQEPPHTRPLTRTRDNGPGPQAGASALGPGDSPPWPRSLPAKQVRVGVWLTDDRVSLCAVSVKDHSLVRWQTHPIPDTLSPGSRTFEKFLGKCLDRFFDGRKKIPVWCGLDASRLKLKPLTVPDLPPGKLANAVYWGVKKDDGVDPAKEILDFEVQDTVTTGGIRKKKVLAVSIPKADVAALTKTFARAGYPLEGVTALPFAVQNLVRRGQIPSDADYFAVVNISRANSEVFCFSRTGLMLVRSLRTGSLNLAEDLDLPQGMDPIDYLASLSSQGPAPDTAMEESGERLISKIIRTGDYCAQNYTHNTPLAQYTFFGDLDLCTPFMNQAETMIPAQVVRYGQNRPTGGPCPAPSALPGSNADRSLVLTAYALGLSTNALTPNFIFTFADRQQAKVRKKLTLAALVSGLALLAATFGAHYFLYQRLNRARADLAQIRQEQARFGKKISKEAISKAIHQAEDQTQIRDRYVKTYLPLAVISEICRHTPDHIRLVRLALGPDRDTPDHGPKSKTTSGTQSKPVPLSLTIEGRVTTHPHDLEASLGKYIITLSESPVFGDIRIEGQNPPESKAPRSDLAFTAVLEVL